MGIENVRILLLIIGDMIACLETENFHHHICISIMWTYLPFIFFKFRVSLSEGISPSPVKTYTKKTANVF